MEIKVIIYHGVSNHRQLDFFQQLVMDNGFLFGKSTVTATEFTLQRASYVVVVVVILFPTEYKQWRAEYMSNIITTRKP